MGKLTEILSLAQGRGKALERPYQGELTPQEASDLLRLAAVEIEWNQYPGSTRNPHFLAEFKRQVDPEALVMFLCRSGVRSIGAAAAATEAGYNSCYNVLEGFEGDKDANGHRNNIGGWRKAGLPWIQG